MAHHHHHHHAPPPPPPPAPAPCCCGGHCCSSGAAHHGPPQPPLDPLVEALLSRLLQPPPLPSPPPQKPHDPFPRTHQETSFGQPHHHRHPRRQFGQDPHSVSSLLDRIDALESSLRSFSVASPPPPPASCRGCRRRFSLRDAAASVIQGHFRAFLVRRSRALRDLERLASIKSASLALRSSVYASSHLDLDRVSRKVTALLLQLDSVQGNSPVIRDSKRKISRDLGCLSEYIDSVAVKRYEISYKAKKSVKSVGGRSKTKDLRDQREVVKNLRTRVERVHELSRALEDDAGKDVELEGFHDFGDGEVDDGRVSRVLSGKSRGVKKVVSFAEDGNVYRIISSNSDEASSSGDDQDGISGGEVLEDFRAHNEVEEMKGSSYVAEEEDDDDDDEEEAEESGESLEGSDGEKHQGRVRSEGKVDGRRGYKGQNSKFTFAAPVPEKMESRADLVKNRKNVKIVTSQQ